MFATSTAFKLMQITILNPKGLSKSKVKSQGRIFSKHHSNHFHVHLLSIGATSRKNCVAHPCSNFETYAVRAW
jgi:hypothetical protein